MKGRKGTLTRDIQDRATKVSITTSFVCLPMPLIRDAQHRMHHQINVLYYISTRKRGGGCVALQRKHINVNTRTAARDRGCVPWSEHPIRQAQMACDQVSDTKCTRTQFCSNGAQGLHARLQHSEACRSVIACAAAPLQAALPALF